ncbi:MAG: hypothetical protein HRT99_00050 [Mycoplasmatales bacterium]|nr:hypothetical protein [Mycoplasmatales bacterium]
MKINFIILKFLRNAIPFKWITAFVEEIIKNKRKRRVRRHAKYIFDVLNKVFKNDYSLVLGGLITLYRDGKINDDDLDLAIDRRITQKDLDELLKYKIYLAGSYYLKGEIKQYVLKYKRVQIDLNIYEESENKYKITSFRWLGAKTYTVTKTNTKYKSVLKNLNGLEVMVPKNEEKLIAEWYGPNWKTPINQKEANKVYSSLKNTTLVENEKFEDVKFLKSIK